MIAAAARCGDEFTSAQIKRLQVGGRVGGLGREGGGGRRGVSVCGLV